MDNLAKLELNIPLILQVRDYHDLSDVQILFHKLSKDIKVVELVVEDFGFEDGYYCFGLVYVKGNKLLKKEIKEMLEKEGLNWL